MSEKIDLMKLVIEVDAELIQEGKEPFQRSMLAYIRIKNKLQPGSSAIFQHDPLYHAVNQIYEDLYRPTDTEMPPMHVGAFMFRDVFFPLRIPLICGSPYINPVDFLTEISEIQKQWLFSEQQTGLTFFDQVIDLMDFVYGLGDIEKSGNLPDRIDVEYWYRAKDQLEAAAATVLGSFSKYAIIQNCCIAAELLLKGALLAKGMEPERTHNLEDLSKKAAKELPNFDLERVLFAVKQLPNYVDSRYKAMKFSRIELGGFLMNTQYVSGEVLRQFSDRNFRADFITTTDGMWNLTHRTFPKK